MPVLLHKADFDFSVMQMEKSIDERGPLDRQTGHKHVEADATKAISLQEGHQETETNEHHHVDILEHWMDKEPEVCR